MTSALADATASPSAASASAPATTRSFADRLRRHLRWQSQLLAAASASGVPPNTRFLLLRPGDKLTVCKARGMGDVRHQCHKDAGRSSQQRPRRAFGAKSGAPEPHWDAVMLAGRPELTRPVPGLGNIMLSFVSAAAAAVVGRRVLQVENWTAAAASLGAPMPELLLETSGWAPHVAALQARGESVDTWAAHDDSSGFDDLCRADLRREPAARVWRIFSNQYFLPLLLLNAHHARPLAAMGGSGGLWGPALRVLLRPQQRLLDAAAAYVTRAGLGRGGARVVGIHARSPLDNAARREATLGCARTRLRAQNASVLFLATMARRTRDDFAGGLRRDGVRVEWYGDAVGVQGETRAQLDAAVLDLWLLGTAEELLVSRGSTFSYVAHGLAGRAATVYGLSHNSNAGHGRLGECARVPTAEPSFHMLGRAIGRPACRAGVANASALPLYAASRHVY